MKKLFTLLMAMACVTMSFAQLNEYQVVNVPDNNEQLRSDWFGWYQTSQTVFVLPAESEYLLRIPAGSFTGSITQVKFYHIAGENITGWANEPGSDQPPFENETYTIKIYTNVQWSQVTYIGDDSQEHTYDTIAPGTPVWTMNYSPTEVGVQNVTLSTPFEITSAMGDVCVAIYAPEMSAMGLCNTDEECAHLNFLNENDGNGWWHPQFGNANTGYNHKPYFLGVYYEDGSSYQPKCINVIHLMNQGVGSSLLARRNQNVMDSGLFLFLTGHEQPGTEHNSQNGQQFSHDAKKLRFPIHKQR